MSIYANLEKDGLKTTLYKILQEIISVKNWNKIVVMICVLGTAGLAIAQNTSSAKKSVDADVLADAPTTQPAEVALSDIKLPPKLPSVAATVGGKEIPGEMINTIVAKNFVKMNEDIKNNMPKVPPERRMGIILNLQQTMDSLPQSLLSKMIFQDLLRNFVKNQNVQTTEADLVKIKENLATEAAKKNITIEEMMKNAGITDKELMSQARFKKIRDQALAPEKVAAFIKGNLSCFNGTKIKASHILIKCNPLAQTTEQKAAIARLEEIAGEILSEKIKFEDAAKKYSADPGSKDKGGSLDEFTFKGTVPPFAMAAFHTKVGKLSGIVRTQFGFHLIKIEKRTEGKEKVDPKLLENEKIAKTVLMSEMENKILGQALTDCPIVIMK